MEYGLFDFLTLLGSLGFFIYGMKVMSEGIQKVAGSKMRQILSAMTSNRFKGVFTGFLITSLIQSSSATTVLVVSFVNAGLLSLVESIGVIMGANIGTTITAWLISIIGFKVKIEAYALPIIAFGFPLLFVNRSKVKSWGEVAIGFALLFMGLAQLKASVPDIGGSPEILAFLGQYTDLGILSTFLFVLIGTILTVIIQSSSATMALTLVMANNGWIEYDIAAAMVLGENIGTTITANLAALVANVHAKRAAFAHFIFNIFGVIWIIILLHPMLWLIDSMMAQSPFDEPSAIPVGLSIFHSTFNIINTLLLLGFVNFIGRVVTKTIKASGEDEDFRLEFISTGLLSTAELSITEASKETVKFGKICTKMISKFRDLLDAKKEKKINKLVKSIQQYEDVTDQMEAEISKYLMRVAEGQLTKNSSDRVARLLSICTDLERIGDITYQMSRDVSLKFANGLDFTKEQKKNLGKMLDLLDEALVIMHTNLSGEQKDASIEPALKLENQIDDLRDELRHQHLKRMEEKNFEVSSGTLYKDLFHSCEKIGDHIINVSEAVTGQRAKDFRGL